MTRFLRGLWLGALLAPAACAQFTLFMVDGNAERSVPAVLDLGKAGRGDTLTARFRLRNTSAAPAPVRVLEVAGVGFSLGAPVVLPQTVSPGAALEFSVVFRAAADGAYSAALRSEGISVLLTASVEAVLAFAVQTPGGPSPLANGATAGFGTVERGSLAALRFLIQNPTGSDRAIPALAIQGDDFRFSAPPPSGAVLHPLEQVSFEIVFSPSATGARRATLLAGDRSFVLNGTGIEPPLPKPRLSISLAQRQSGQQGSVAVMLAEVSRTSGTGTLAFELRPQIPGAADPAVQFAQGSRTVSFTVAPGDDRAWFGERASAAFQTGTTAGTLVFSVTLGSAGDQQSVEIAPGPVGVSAVAAVRTPAGVEVRVSGFDNTRTAGPLAFTFFDRAGAPIPPGAVRADGSAEFGRYFQQSEAGGTFLLRAAFPVTGDAAFIDAVEVELTNSAGTARSTRTKF